MDGGGRVAESLTGPTVPPGALARSRTAPRRGTRAFSGEVDTGSPSENATTQREKSEAQFYQNGIRSRKQIKPARWNPVERLRFSIGNLQRRLRGGAASLLCVRRYRIAAATASIAVIIAGSAFTAVHWGQGPRLVGWFTDARDALANASGFRIRSVAIAGHKHLSRDEVLAIAGVNGRTSLLFLDAAAARAKLKANPWIGDATVQKLFPDQLTITVRERVAFALWQKNNQINVIADDGTVLESYVTRSLVNLPFVVGGGADKRAKEFLTVLARYPDIRKAVQASVFVGKRRWSLKLKNGVDVRLPETGIAHALDQLAAFDREKKLLSRDIVAVDLRVPDRLIVQLSDSAARARDEALKAKRSKPKGGSA
jgi:cell division protein FtsQ